MSQTSENATSTVEIATARSLIHSHPGIMNGAPVFTGTQVPLMALFDSLAHDKALREFHENFPTVSSEQAARAVHMARSLLEAYAYGDAIQLDKLCAGGSVIHRDAGMVWGNPVFKGTRMTMRTFFDHLAGGYSITEFLADFDTAVTHEQAIQAIQMAEQALENYAYATASR